jgi:hypothetical protein
MNDHNTLTQGNPIHPYVNILRLGCSTTLGPMVIPKDKYNYFSIHNSLWGQLSIVTEESDLTGECGIGRSTK